MHWNRHVGPILASLAVLAAPLAAQNGSIHGQVIDSVTQQGLAGATVQLVFRSTGLIVEPGRQTLTDVAGRFTMSDIAPGAVSVKVTRIGFAPQQQEVNVTAGAAADTRFALAPQASILEPVVVTGYGSQRREAITGSVSTVQADVANVGVKTNGVVLIETKKGNASSGPTFEYDGYVSTSSPTRRLDVLNGAEYRAYALPQITAWVGDSNAFCGRHAASCGVDSAVYNPVYRDSVGLFAGIPHSHLSSIGTANTNWAQAISRTSVTHNHNLAFSGGTEATRYRASLNYANQQGVTLSSGLERIQGRLSATHSDLNNRLRMELNVTTSRVNNTYLTYENNGGFEGGAFENVATFNPTLPVKYSDSLGTHFYEVGGLSIRNPVAMAAQITNIGP